MRTDARLWLPFGSALTLAVPLTGCARPAATTASEPPPLYSHGPPPGFNKRPIMSTVIRLPEGRPVRVLFIGNSLTGAHELPRIVQAIAASAGKRLEFNACLRGGANLEDHWNDRRCLLLLREDPWDYVVLQQGPSSLPESQVDLRKWSARWADEVRKQKARPALYMVWPRQSQPDGFELVTGSYTRAAAQSGSLLFAAGDAWMRSLDAASDIALYDRDGLHPTLAGAYLAALVITRGVIGKSVEKTPARLEIATGRYLDVPAGTCERLRRIALAGPESSPP